LRLSIVGGREGRDLARKEMHTKERDHLEALGHRWKDDIK
jgi:hypothetical protein